MIDWIKVTPDTMPDKCKMVMVTYVSNNSKNFMKDVWWNGMEWRYNDGMFCYKTHVLHGVTHWAHYPAPA